ncbi:NAD(P)H-hydrate dehydratase [Deinococcus sonorensis]|uniref:Bifunctional NAD(P)H-hydrate repair enzyme n=2 Tax=Deinococcus sonorensis TaxID=309891 RepID=A0AAU7UBE9_9DEIO
MIVPTALMQAEPVLTSEGVRRMDAQLERAGLLELSMEAAGRAVAQLVCSRWPGKRVLLLAGSGANGGDAYVAARLLLAAGQPVNLLGLPVRHPLARRQRARFRAVDGAPLALNAATLRRALADADVVVDGLLGTGFVPPLRASLAALLGQLRASGRPVVAIDLPSGLDAGSPQAPDDVLQAAVSVTFAGPRPAHLYGTAAVACGELVVASLEVPPGWAQAQAVALRPTDAELGRLLPRRTAGAHKGTAGRVWVVGGHPGTVGAPVLSGVGALRAGAGLVTLYTAAPELGPLAVGVAPELMVRVEPDLRTLQDAARPDALALGMGLGPDAEQLARLALSWQLPTVLDADALQPGLRGHGHDRVVWTPHPGEAARLLACATEEVVADPLKAARELQQQYGGVVVLKGGPTTVAGPDEVYVARGGHPGMASAGMGDTLSGIIAALLGQGLSPLEAALCGVRLHARAGERAGARHGYGLVATDVADELGAAWLDLLAAPG